MTLVVKKKLDGGTLQNYSYIFCKLGANVVSGLVLCTSNDIVKCKKRLHTCVLG
jgi:hypothetical protein